VFPVETLVSPGCILCECMWIELRPTIRHQQRENIRYCCNTAISLRLDKWPKFDSIEIARVRRKSTGFLEVFSSIEENLSRYRYTRGLNGGQMLPLKLLTNLSVLASHFTHFAAPLATRGSLKSSRVSSAYAKQVPLFLNKCHGCPDICAVIMNSRNL